MSKSSRPIPFVSRCFACVLFAIAVLGGGCGGSNDITAGLTGIVVQLAGGDVMIVDQTANAPEGSTPVDGAQVLVKAPFAEAASTNVTDASGKFSVSGLYIAHAIVEARLNAGSSEADASTNVTLVPGATIAVGAIPAVSREEAIQAVLAIVGSSPLVVCAQNPLPVGTRVAPTSDNSAAGESAVATHTVSSGGEWFLLVDANTDQGWAHDVVYYFVNAVDGTLTSVASDCLPAINTVPYWDYDEQLVVISDFAERNFIGPPLQVTIQTSADIVQLPTTSDISQPEGAYLAGRMRAAREPRLLGASTEACRGISEDDRFALIVGGTPEDWIVQDVKKMRSWAIAQEIPEENITVILFSSASARTLVSAPNGWSLVAVETQTTTQEQAATIIAALSEKIKTRRDAGGHPCLFVSVISHGNPKGEILVIDKPLGNLVNWIRGKSNHVKLVNLVPVHTIPACQVRMTIDCCYSGTHLKDYMSAFASMDHDVEIYTSAGAKVMNLIATWGAISRAAKSFFIKGNHDDAVEALGDLSMVGSWFTKAWVTQVSLNAGNWLLSNQHGNWDTLPGGPTEFTAITTTADIDAAFADDTRPKNDRMSWNPNRPDQCCTVSEGIEDTSLPPFEEIDIHLNKSEKTFIHKVGLTACPQLIGTFIITNLGTDDVTWTATSNHGAIYLKEASGSLAVLAPVEVEMWFDCSTTSPFQAMITVTGTAASGTFDMEAVMITADIR